MPTAANRIAFQGYPGAYSNLACKSAFPAMTPLRVYRDRRVTASANMAAMEPYWAMP